MSAFSMPYRGAVTEKNTVELFASGVSRLVPLLKPFSYPQQPSDYAALINSRWQKLAAGAERLPAKLISVAQQTNNSRSLELKPGLGWRGHKAGQFINLHVNINGVWHNRCYSITSSDQQRRTIQIAVRAIENGLVSNYLVHSAAVGERLHISQAQGDFVVAKEGASESQKLQTDERKLFITAGSGITPAVGMLNSLNGASHCVHIHYEREAENIVFAEQLHTVVENDASYQLHKVLTASGGQRFSESQLAELCPDWQQRRVWVCGPAGLLNAAEQHWAAAGLESQLKTERFKTQSFEPAADSASGAAVSTAHFSASNVQAKAAADASLLSVAEQAGLSPQHGCRMGICHSCDCTLVSGRVRDLRTGNITDQAGVQIQPCISAAVGSVALDL